MNKFIDTYEKNPAIFNGMVDHNYISEDDMVIALNRNGDYTYEEEVKARERIQDGLKRLKDKNPNNKTVTSLYKNFPKEDYKNVKITTPDDILTYQPEEMEKVAEDMKFRWNNAEDRKAMMKELTDEKIQKEREDAVNNYEHSYFGMDKDNPINKGMNWLADKIISDDTKKAIIEDPSNTSRIVGNAATDIGGTAADFLPGVGGYVVGPAIRMGRDIAEGKDASTIAENVGKDLAVNAVVGAGLKGVGGIADDVPIFKGAARKLKDTIGKWEDLIEQSKKDIPNAKTPHTTKTKTEMQDFVDGLPEHERKAYDDVLKDGNWKKKEVVEEAHKKAKTEVSKERHARTNAKKRVEANKAKVATATVFGRTAQGSARVVGHNAMPAQTKKPTIEEIFKAPDMQRYIRLRKQGYFPQIPEKYKDYKEAVDAEIFDFNKNLRGE